MHLEQSPEYASSMPDRPAFQPATREIARCADLLIAVIEPLTQEQPGNKAGGVLNTIGALARHLTA